QRRLAAFPPRRSSDLFVGGKIQPQQHRGLALGPEARVLDVGPGLDTARAEARDEARRQTLVGGGVDPYVGSDGAPAGSILTGVEDRKSTRLNSSHQIT